VVLNLTLLWLLKGKSQQYFHEVQPTLLDVLKERELYSEELVQRIIETRVTADLEDLPEDIRNAFPTAMEVAPEWHVRMQAAWQENIDSSISKTVNLPYQSTVEDIETSISWL